MAGIECTFYGYSSGVIDYYIDGVHQPTDGRVHFVLENNEYIYFVPLPAEGRNYGINSQKRSGVDNDYTFTAPIITVDNFRNTGIVYFNGDTSFTGDFLFATNYTVINGNAAISTQNIQMIGGVLHLENGYINLDNIVWGNRHSSNFEFGSNAQLQITSSSNGKTLIKATTVTGRITLDVQSGVQEGDTFLIEATDNQLIITDGEWTATPSTSGNITTYTLSKAALQKPKFRLLYTVG